MYNENSLFDPDNLDCFHKENDPEEYIGAEDTEADDAELTYEAVMLHWMDMMDTVDGEPTVNLTYQALVELEQFCDEKINHGSPNSLDYQVLKLRVIEQLTYTQIEEASGLNANKIRWSLHRVAKSIRKDFQSETVTQKYPYLSRFIEGIIGNPLLHS